MIIKRELLINQLHYVLKFEHYSFSFYLVRLPSFKRSFGGRVRKDASVLFADEPHYDDLNIQAPAFEIFSWVMQQIEGIVYQYGIQYWEFSATSAKKARIYEKMLKRYIGQQHIHVNYVRDGLNFYVYPDQMKPAISG